ncbi:amphi-Trp domain-containing protein [Natronococcus sp.]|uniref:amphi-Trp domain-containing protein n=1 Tax=Natronococcus sp. TaxID=35747 RepID=UPI003A4DB7F5
MTDEEEDHEEELLEAELEQSPDQAADWLRNLADELEDGEELTVSTDDESVTVALPEDSLEFEVELEREPEDDEYDEIELEIELEWLVPSSDADEE